MPNVKIVGIDSNKFTCSYLHELFRSIAFENIDGISERLYCSSMNNASDTEMSTSKIEQIESTQVSKSYNETTTQATDSNAASDFITKETESATKSMVFEEHVCKDCTSNLINVNTEK